MQWWHCIYFYSYQLDLICDVLTVRKYATANDKKRAIAVMISGYSFVLVVFSAAALGIV
ncbi:MAG: hypothetical protein P8176_16575 [Gammaproteobacteria bacterium]